MKNAIIQVTYFFNNRVIKLLFYCHTTLYWEKVTSYEKFSHIWKISEFRCYWWKHQNAEIYLNFQNFQLKWKVLKYFARPKQWPAFRKLFSQSPDKSSLWRYTDILFPSIWIMHFLGVQKCCSAIFFLTSTRDMFAGKFVKWVDFRLGFGSIFFIMLSELRFVK